jgi:alkylation response protein AidB-like acyl-CoA dehydrogenase
MLKLATPSPESLEDFADRAEAWLHSNVPPAWRDARGALSADESDEIRREWDRQLWSGDFSGIRFSREYGGLGYGLAEDVVFHVLAAQHKAPDGFSRVGKTLVGPMLVGSGTPEQREKYLPPMFRGEEIWCQGFSEPDAGSDLANIRTRARKVDGGYLLTGRKTWTTFAQHADRCFVLAVTDDSAPRHKNLSMFLVDMHASGVTADDIRQISGATHFAETQFNDVFVADADRVGEEGQGWKIAMKVLGEERGGSETAARYVEIRSDVDLLLESCAGRTDLAGEIEDLDLRTELLRWQLAKVIELESTGGDRFARAVSILKVQWSELWQAVTKVGISALVPADRDHWRYQYLEARGVSIYSGTNEIQRNIISERVLGLPR